MDKKRKQRYVLAVYLLLATISIILALAGLNYFSPDNPIRGLILNMSTDLAGVVVIFFIVNQLFLLDRDNELLSEIEHLKNNISAKFNPITWEKEKKESLERFNFEKHLLIAESIDMLGYTLANMLEAYREQIVNAIRKGTHFRIMIVNATGAAGKLISKVSLDPEAITRDAKRSAMYFREIQEMLSKGEVKGSLSIRLISWAPSCNMIMVDRNRETGISKVGIHSPSLRLPIAKEYRDKIYLILDHIEYPKEFDYFKNQFELLWMDKDTIPLESVDEQR